jgi:hypothetical protein
MDKHDYSAHRPDAGTASDARGGEHAAPLVHGWSRLSGQLVPLIGENGFGALFGRTVRLVASVHPWLSVDASRKTSATLLAGLEADLAGVDGAAAAQAHAALMGTFTGQLGALIGPGLTARLLAENAAGAEQQQKQQEHKE